MRHIARLMFLLLLTLLGGCDDGASPTGPIPQAPAAPQPPAVMPAVAELTVSNGRVETTSGVFSDGRRWWKYSPRFRLTERSGLSGASITRVIVTPYYDDSEQVGEGCWGQQIRVEPGRVSEAFGDNAGLLGDCAPGIARGKEFRAFQIEVVYADDEGRTGSVFEDVYVRE